MKAIVGIDPGTKGGLSLLIDGVPTEYEPMPDSAKGIKAWLEMAQACCLDREMALVVELQQPMPKKGAVGANQTATMMRKFGQWEIFALMMGIPYHEVRPGTWKKAMGLNNDKARSVELCQQLFPTVNLILPRCRNAHDGIAEAILIAEYARRARL